MSKGEWPSTESCATCDKDGVAFEKQEGRAIAYTRGDGPVQREMCCLPCIEEERREGNAEMKLLPT